MKLGIALGGGGAKGFAHIGVLQVLDEAGIDVEVVAGTSIGALVGAVYASNRLNELAAAADSITAADIPRLLTPTLSTSGLFSGENALRFFESFFAEETLEGLPKRLAVVSVDLISGALVAHLSGPLRESVRASFSIPILFTPVAANDRLLADGGLIEPVPVKAARDLGADAVIAVDLFGHHTPPLRDCQDNNKSISTFDRLKKLSSRLPLANYIKSRSGEELAKGNFLSILESTLSISQRQLTIERLKSHPAEVVVRPQVADIGLMDFHLGAAGIEAGREAAQKLLQTIKELK